MPISAGIRLGIGLPVAALVTLSLFLLMRALIFVEGEPPQERAGNLTIDIVATREDTDVLTRTNRPDQPDEVRTPPPPPRIEADKAEAPEEGLATTLGRLPDLNVDRLEKSDISFQVSDREEQPLVRGEQRYPRRALERGIEGKCTLGFDVNPDGTTTNVSVIQCSDSMFEREGIRAVERYKYAPKIVDGQAVMRRGLRIDLEWQLAE